MSNKLPELNTILFKQLDRLMEAETIEQLQSEMDRGKAVSAVASQIIANAKLVLEAQIALGGDNAKQLPDMLGITSE
ncbi:MAG: hypothetical protein KGZ88_12035 [Methylomicrobium sp.]|nr:hypothetical protein [Methylomicrobium sp.]